MKVVLEYMQNHDNSLPTVKWVAEKLGISRTIYRICKKQVLVKLVPRILSRGTEFTYVAPNFDPETSPIKIHETGEIEFLGPTKTR